MKGPQQSSVLLAGLVVVLMRMGSASATSTGDVDDLKITAPFFESFSSPSVGDVWIASTASKSGSADETDEELLRYKGEWAFEGPSAPPALAADIGLVLKTVAARHAISARFPAPVDMSATASDEPLVIQYEVKLQTGLECGGAYMKLLTHDPAFDPKAFEEKTPYTIMFGPDRCGTTNKVHFIFRHVNPVDGSIEEKHMNTPPAAVMDQKTNLYTLIVRPDNSFEVLINNVSAKAGSLLTDMSPPVNPAETIADPTDSKPADWVDAETMTDPDAVKPADWDEEAPASVVDETAAMPEGWLVEEDDQIPDPTAVKPEEWLDEEDGDWVAPLVPNPKCEAVGCGPWTQPMIRNPAYKGKWSAPMIPNPAYKGPWAPRSIPNPAYFSDPAPYKFSPIGAIGFELWTMSANILFDNVYVGHSIAEAQKLAEASYVAKHAAEAAAEPEPVAPEAEAKADGAGGESGASPYSLAALLTKGKASLDLAQVAFVKYAAAFSSDPLGTMKSEPTVTASLLLAFLSVLSLPFSFALIFMSAPAKKGKGAKVTSSAVPATATTTTKASTKAAKKAAVKADETGDETATEETSSAPSTTTTTTSTPAKLKKRATASSSAAKSGTDGDEEE